MLAFSPSLLPEKEMRRFTSTSSSGTTGSKTNAIIRVRKMPSSCQGSSSLDPATLPQLAFLRFFFFFFPCFLDCGCLLKAGLLGDALLCLPRARLLLLLLLLFGSMGDARCYDARCYDARDLLPPRERSRAPTS